MPDSDAVAVCLDEDWQALDGESNRNPASQATAENLAYVIYTSGSTGQPKGVCVQHESVVGHCTTIQGLWELSPPRTTSYQSWAERLAEYARTPELRRAADCWLDAPWSRMARLPMDYPIVQGAMGRTRSARVALSEEETRVLLHDLPRRLGAGVEDALFTAFARAVSEATIRESGGV